VFITEEGLFEPTVMFFGLCNSPATFQAYMNDTFRMELNKGWLVIYMDDMLIFSDTVVDHQQRTRVVLDKL
jgi:Reverse transcriptase (RNA-dependent DNA polymerase)